MPSESSENAGDNDIAVIGMAGRFPGAKDLDEFWTNLRDGVESRTVFSDEDLLAAGVPAEMLANPSLIKGRPILPDVDMFDAAFFGYTPREAEMIDPQQRLFLECAWEALESAGYDPDRVEGAVGVFGGAGFLGYFFANLHANQAYLRSVGMFPALLGSDKDFLAPRVSYKLNLRGPSINVVTGCSSSLVGVHLACQSLLNGESDMALAGGATIYFPQRAGYVYQDGSVNSPDGHCRAFDAEAAGTVPGDGVGIVLLKRLSDALEDRDTIHGVIKGTAVNNDGAQKAGFTAPSVQGQAAVISEALAVAEAEPESISYVETHGTGTQLGDAIEIAALTQAFATDQRGYCRIGSVKPNVGHTDTAAGVIGLIKVLLAFRHGALPPSLNYRSPNPQIDFATTPFTVNSQLSVWKSDGSPRRAAVSSFSVGGTNAHAVLEEPPPTPRHPSPEAHGWHLLPVSASTEPALEAATDRLAEFLTTHPEAALPDVARTLQTGRRHFEHRRIVACRHADDAVQALAHRRAPTARQTEKPGAITFLFPGQGSQYAGMAKELYQQEPEFRSVVDSCAELLRPELGMDLRDVLYPRHPSDGEARERINQTWLTQPALFVTEYAMARLLMSRGVQPEAMIGHSIGELVAACLAGVFSLPDALSLVALRGRLVQDMPRGAMLAVAASPEHAQAWLGEELALAAVNSSEQVVISGPAVSIDALRTKLQAEGITHARLRTSHAFHSAMMAPAAQRFTTAVAARTLHEPRLPYLSNVTGTWITPDQARDPAYWGRQLRETVRFGDGIGELLRDSRRVLVEVGPGDTLRGLLAHGQGRARVLTTLPRNDSQPADAAWAWSLAHLWLAGADLDWSSICDQDARRIALPTYPFQRQRYWVAPDPQQGATPAASLRAPASEARDEAPASGVTTETAEDDTRPEPATASQHPRPDLSTPYTAPSTPTEHAVAAVWTEVMGVSPIGAHDNFFDLGGHSLLAAQVVARLTTRFPLALSAADVLAHGQTVAEAAQLIDQKLTTSASDDADIPLTRITRRT
ncbi:type I polyketide synthase [Streptomyces sp. NPDC102405]|uniref:type I polyketide synthase n=1 Tax=Streptomyces sp. NPDC102405 TaxID=3366170 RepID=UPI0037FC7BCB